MDECEQKISSLKKVYAEIMLNMAKESAARILASETKAAQFQRSLSSSKEEAVRTLLRVKGIMDAKINAKEKASSIQKKRIQELKNQLNAAHDTITCLEMELARLYSGKEKTGTDPEEKVGRQDKEHHCTGRGSNQLCVSLPGSPVSDERHIPKLQRPIENQSTSGECYVANSGNIRQNIPKENSSPENIFSNKPDLAAIIMRSEKPELYRNGCTQRIRAFEHDTMAGENFSGQTDICTSNTVSITGGDKIISRPHAVASLQSGNLVDCADTQNVIHGKVPLHRNEDLAASFSRKRRRSIRGKTTHCHYSDADIADHTSLQANHEKTQNKHEIVEILIDQEETHKDSCLNPLTVSLENHNEETLGCQSAVLGQLAVKGTEAEFSDTNSSEKKVVHKNIVGIPELSEADVKSTSSYRESADNGEIQNVINEEELLMSISDKKASAELPSVAADQRSIKKSEPNGFARQFKSNRPLKYTFQRKRMRGCSSGGNEAVILEMKNSQDGKLSNKMNASPQCQKATMTPELSRDSRRIAQVARQLIALSEKKW